VYPRLKIFALLSLRGPSWPWSYCNWAYN